MAMRIYAIGDLHLSGSEDVDKPMDVFGEQWSGHRERLERRWRETVDHQDAVLVCGDLSWAMTLEEAAPDLEFLDALPGTKYLIRGNHDYWYSGPSKVRRATGGSIRLVRFDAHVFGRAGICGVRAWPWPGMEEYDEEDDAKNWRRAKMRLEMSLDALAELEWDEAVAMFHYPPILPGQTSELCGMIKEAGVTHCVYGHLHDEAIENAFEGAHDGVEYRCVSADAVDFTPIPVLEA